MLKIKRQAFAKNKIVIVAEDSPRKSFPASIPSSIQSKDSTKDQLLPYSSEGELCGFAQISGGKSSDLYHLEKLRNLGHQVYNWSKSCKINIIHISQIGLTKVQFIAIIEGIALSNYEFIKYKNVEEKKKQFLLKEIQVEQSLLEAKDIKEFNNLTDSIFIARDLINEPLSFLTAKQYSMEMKKLSQKYGFKLTTLNEKQISNLKMGGILAVNKGSVLPPTFNIMEWKPAKAKNAKPIVLVGKGVVYDTGGLSLKPTLNSMDIMKSDMTGSALVVGLMCAIASNNLPYHIVGLVPAVENRPGGDAYVPGDVITMMDKTTVEVLNTDAEGRMILADALTYAKRYKPELVLEFSTLTGAAVALLSSHAALLMGNASDEIKTKIKHEGDQAYERLIELPIWKEYQDMMKSDIADLKNVSTGAGAMTAGCFLHHFTDYPWLHFDLSEASFLQQVKTYRPKGGTGSGIRTIYNFLKSY